MALVNGDAEDGPVVEENGPWFVVFICLVGLLLAASAFAVVHSLMVTFN